MLPEPGDVVDGKYRVVRLIGVGGMGSVFEARHEVLGTVVALKFLDPELAETPGLKERFLQEARVSATVQSPHVARVFDVGRANGDAYLVMELLTGESLADVLAGVGRLSLDRAMDVALQILAGLEVAHGLGVVHRDLKPDNAFITAGSAGLVKLLDFGIAKLKQSPEFVQVVTRPGSMMGTPSYMAPEQAIAAELVDERADIYSVGVIVYEMLTGARPVDDDEPSVIVEAVMMGRAVPITQRDPTLPKGLTDLVTSALAPNPEHRPRTAHDFRLALLPFAGELSPAGRLAAAGPDASGLVPASLTPSLRARSDAPPPRPASDAPPRPLSDAPPPRASTVPKTIPPDDSGPPRSIVPPPPSRTGTAPPRWEPFPAGAPSLPVAPARRRRSGGLWAALTLLLVAGGGVAAAAYVGVLDGSPPPAPPLPAPPVADTASTELDVPEPRRPSRAEPRPRAPSRSGGGGSTPQAPSPGEPTSPPVGVPLPTIQIPQLPTVLPPLPPGITLPPGFPIALPSATQVAPSSGAAPSGSSAAPAASQ